MRGTVYTEEMIDWLRENAPGHLWKETLKKFNDKFGTDIIATNLRQVAGRRNIYCGIDCSFKKGQNAWNKGLKGVNFGGKETQFKKGHMPHNHRPVGSERVLSREEYVEVKVAEPNKWKLKHILVWENYYHEKVNTHKDCIIHLDGNRKNCDISNLKKIPRKLSVRMSQLGLWNKDKELTETGLNIAKIAQKIGELKHGK